MEDCLSHILRPSRREVIAGAGASALALTAGPGFAARSLVASGTVFEATSADGQRRQGDRGLADVLVSNGRDVVRTDADGRWRLPIAHGDSLFVVKPPNWSTPHRPPRPATLLLFASAAWQPVSAPPRRRDTDRTAARVRSTLRSRAQPESARFEAVLLSDTQPENAAELAYLRDDIIVGLIGSDAAFGINHGDVVADDLSLYPRYLDLLRTTGMPLASQPGQPRSELGRRQRSSRPRNVETLLWSAPLCLPARPGDLHPARQCPLRRPPGGWPATAATPENSATRSCSS